MKVVGLDIETTGLDWQTGHRIIEIALLELDTSSGVITDKFVQQFDPGRQIDPDAERVHGISYEKLFGKPFFKQQAQQVADFIARGEFLIVHNLGFDAPFVASEFQMANVAMPSVTGFCTMENARWACADGKLPKLQELCFALNEPYDPSLAHAAEYDTERMLRCLVKGMQRGFYQLKKETTS